MEPIGPKIAEGRDSRIYEHGPGKVLRVNKYPRDLSGEARIMNYVREHGYPVPEVFDAGDGWLLMERVDGVDLLDAIKKTPAGLREAAATLAELHASLGSLTAPDWLVEAPGPAGDRMVHLDLHPLNVMMTGDGPVVIDWGNAKRGDPAADVANTWSLLACATAPGHGPKKWVIDRARGFLLSEFLDRVDRDAAAKVMKPVVEWRNVDRNMSLRERTRLSRLAKKVG